MVNNILLLIIAICFAVGVGLLVSIFILNKQISNLEICAYLIDSAEEAKRQFENYSNFVTKKGLNTCDIDNDLALMLYYNGKLDAFITAGCKAEKIVEKILNEKIK